MGAGRIVDVENQVLIQITIAKDEDGNDTIYMYPQRKTDAVIYSKHAGGHPATPEQVRWVVKGLGGNQRLVIDRKDKKSGLFPGTPYVIEGGNGENTFVTNLPPAGETGSWRYSVALFEGQKKLHLIDPTIDIKEDP